MSVVNAKCPNCGASIQLDNERSEGFCSYCGSKIKVEEAQKLMIQGTVKVDTSDELANLYQIARRAKDADNSENAHKYYDMILVKDPNSWEATFYVTYYQAMQCKIAGIWSAANSLLNCEAPVLELVKNTVSKGEWENVISEIYIRLTTLSSMLFNASKNHFNSIDIQIRDNYGQEYINNAHATVFLMYTLGDLLVEKLGDEYGHIAALCWKDGIDIHKNFIYLLNGKEKDLAIIDKYVSCIKKYDSTYVKPEIQTVLNTNSGCYIATSIYGSYDCPQVWTLRRFRDNTLDNYWTGRSFIKTYYAISPTLVKWFGESSIFKGIFTPILNHIVSTLKKRGVSDMPYNDKY